MRRKIFNLARFVLRPLAIILKRLNLQIENLVVKKILTAKHHFLLSFFPVFLVRLINRFYPRLGSILFVIQYKHSSQRYFLWNQFNFEIRTRICQPISNKEIIDSDAFNFFVNATYIPISILQLFQVFELMNVGQRDILLNHVKYILQKLSCKNQDLYTKQLLHLLIKYDLSELTLRACCETIRSAGANFVCEYHSGHINCYSESKGDLPETIIPYSLSNAVFQHPSFFATPDETYLFRPTSESLDTNFFEKQFFFAKNSNSFIFFRHRMDEIKDFQRLSNATLLLPFDLSTNQYELLLALVYKLSCDADIGTPNAGIVLIPHKPYPEMLKYLKDKFDFNGIAVDNGPFFVESLNISAAPRIEKLNADQVDNIKQFILTKHKLGPNQFDDQIVVMTNSFQSVEENELASMAKIVKHSGGVFLDIQLVPFEDILSAFINAKTVICGEHPILALQLLRPKNLTIVLRGPRDSENCNGFKKTTGNLRQYNFHELKPESLYANQNGEQ